MLAGCGVDGEPETPTVSPSVTISNSGVRLGTKVGLGVGPVRVGLGVSL